MEAHHEPVLLDAALELLAPERGGLFVDATVGLGGHAAALLDAAPRARLWGVDRDPEALAVAARRLHRFGDRVRLVEGRLGRLAELPGAPGRGQAAGILADLGVSSLQLDRPGRGFSFRADGPLDMRMGGGGRTAAEVVNESSEAELERIFRQYGEERQARRIARAVARRRRERPLATTAELRDLVHRVKRSPRPRSGRRTDPATLVFQALRIEVNRELDELEGFLDRAVDLLEADGRLVVISYHSLEDRAVKNRLRDLARGEVDPITGRPLAESRLIEVLTKKPLRPTPREVVANPRSRSARLRAARRLE